MLVKTRDFGEIEIAPADIITFAEPIFGFEAYRKFFLLQQEELGPHFSWLQSAEEPMVCFVLADPHDVAAEYRVQLPRDAVEKLGEGEYLYRVLTVIRDPYYESTVNLKSPIVINPKQGRALQVILEEPYPIRHPLVQKKEDV